MAPAAHDSDSNGSNAEESPRHSKSQGQSPERHDQSDQPRPADSGEDSEVYEIEAILDAKRGATGSVRFFILKTFFEKIASYSLPKTRIGYLVKWKGYPDEENSWVDERDAV
jgi:chromobox protein 5